MQMKKVIPLVLVMLFTLTGCAIPLFNTKANVSLSGTPSYNSTSQEATIQIQNKNSVKADIENITVEYTLNNSNVKDTITPTNNVQIVNGLNTIIFKPFNGKDVTGVTQVNIKINMKDENGNKITIDAGILKIEEISKSLTITNIKYDTTTYELTGTIVATGISGIIKSTTVTYYGDVITTAAITPTIPEDGTITSGSNSIKIMPFSGTNANFVNVTKISVAIKIQDTNGNEKTVYMTDVATNYNTGLTYINYTFSDGMLHVNLKNELTVPVVITGGNVVYYSKTTGNPTTEQAFTLNKTLTKGENNSIDMGIFSGEYAKLTGIGKVKLTLSARINSTTDRNIEFTALDAVYNSNVAITDGTAKYSSVTKEFSVDINASGYQYSNITAVVTKYYTSSGLLNTVTLSAIDAPQNGKLTQGGTTTLKYKPFDGVMQSFTDPNTGKAAIIQYIEPTLIIDNGVTTLNAGKKDAFYNDGQADVVILTPLYDSTSKELTFSVKVNNNTEAVIQGVDITYVYYNNTTTTTSISASAVNFEEFVPVPADKRIRVDSATKETAVKVLPFAGNNWKLLDVYKVMVTLNLTDYSTRTYSLELLKQVDYKDGEVKIVIDGTPTYNTIDKQISFKLKSSNNVTTEITKIEASYIDKNGITSPSALNLGTTYLNAVAVAAKATTEYKFNPYDSAITKMLTGISKVKLNVYVEGLQTTEVAISSPEISAPYDDGKANISINSPVYSTTSKELSFGVKSNNNVGSTLSNVNLSYYKTGASTATTTQSITISKTLAANGMENIVVTPFAGEYAKLYDIAKIDVSVTGTDIYSQSVSTTYTGISAVYNDGKAIVTMSVAPTYNSTDKSLSFTLYSANSLSSTLSSIGVKYYYNNGLSTTTASITPFIPNDSVIAGNSSNTVTIYPFDSNYGGKPTLTGVTKIDMDVNLQDSNGNMLTTIKKKDILLTYDDGKANMNVSSASYNTTTKELSLTVKTNNNTGATLNSAKFYYYKTGETTPVTTTGTINIYETIDGNSTKTFIVNPFVSGTAQAKLYDISKIDAVISGTDIYGQSVTTTKTGISAVFNDGKANITVGTPTYSTDKEVSLPVTITNGLSGTISAITVTYNYGGNTTTAAITPGSTTLLADVTNTIRFKPFSTAATMVLYGTTYIDISYSITDENGNVQNFIKEQNNIKVDYETTAVPLPTNVSASNGVGLINLTWTAAAGTNILGYNVYVSTTPNGTYSKLNNNQTPNVRFGSNLTLYNNDALADSSNLTPANDYYFRVTTINDVGRESDRSTLAFGYMESDTAPVIRDTDIQKDIGHYNDGTRLVRGLKLTWPQQTSSATVTNYAILKRTGDSGEFVKLTEISTANAIYIDSTSFPEGVNIYYAIACRDGNGLGKPSGYVTVTNDVLPAPIDSGTINITAHKGYKVDNSEINDNTFSLEWTGVPSTMKDFAGYKVYMARDNPKGDYRLMRIVTGNKYVTIDPAKYYTIDSTGGEVENVTGWTTGEYYIKISAFDLFDNETAKSQYKKAVNEPVSGVIALSGFADGSSTKTVYLSWTGIYAPKYYVYKKLSTSSNFVKVAETLVPEYKDTNVDTTKTYNYKVMAVDAWGNTSRPSGTDGVTANVSLDLLIP